MLITDVPMMMFYIYPKGHFKNVKDFKDFEGLDCTDEWMRRVILYNSKDVIGIRRTSEYSYQYLLRGRFKEFEKYIYNNDNIAIGEL